MKQANELRIGNYVASDHFKDRDVIVKIRLIGQEQAIVEHSNGLTEPMLYNGEMRAIPLTEELLLKCGFTVNASQLYVLDDTRFCLHKPKDFDGYLACWGGVVIGEVASLHQLQNLIHVLTGQELEVNLKE